MNPTTATPPFQGTWDDQATADLGRAAMIAWALSDQVWPHLKRHLAAQDADAEALAAAAADKLAQLLQVVIGRTPDTLARQLLAAHASRANLTEAAFHVVARWLQLPHQAVAA